MYLCGHGVNTFEHKYYIMPDKIKIVYKQVAIEANLPLLWC